MFSSSEMEGCAKRLLRNVIETIPRCAQDTPLSRSECNFGGFGAENLSHAQLGTEQRDCHGHHVRTTTGMHTPIPH